VKFAKLHKQLLSTDLGYRQRNADNYPVLGAEAWANKLRFEETPPNAQEILLSLLHPTAALQVATNALTATLEQRRLYPIISNGSDISNAFRHTYWNALNASSLVIRPDIAKLFGDAHEFGQTGLATVMDLFNNAVGIQIGINTGTFMSESARANAVLLALQAGQLKYICNNLLIFTNQIC
jgi:hypothetical protein